MLKCDGCGCEVVPIGICDEAGNAHARCVSSGRWREVKFQGSPELMAQRDELQRLREENADGANALREENARIKDASALAGMVAEKEWAEMREKITRLREENDRLRQQATEAHGGAMATLDDWKRMREENARLTRVNSNLEACREGDKEELGRRWDEIERLKAMKLPSAWSHECDQLKEENQRLRMELADEKMQHAVALRMATTATLELGWAKRELQRLDPRLYRARYGK